MSKKVSDPEKKSISDEATHPIQESLYDAILAKMNTRTLDVESTLRKERVKPTKRSSPNGKSVPSPKETRTIVQSKKEDMEINTEQIKEINTILSTLKKHREIEASYGFFEKGDFHPGVGSHTDFSNLSNFLESCNNPVFSDPQESETIVEIMKDENGDIRRMYDLLYPGDISFERKIRYFEDSVRIEQFGVRISTSKEKSEDKHPKLWKPHMRRFRRRKSYSTRDSSSDFYGFQIDLTVVQESKLRWEGKKEITDKSMIKYEVEIEVKNAKKTGKQFASIIKFIYRNLIANLSPMSVGDQILFTMDERKYITSLHNELFASDILDHKKTWKPYSKFRMYNYTFWNKPRNITLKDLQPKLNKKSTSTFQIGSSSPTLKLNGKRMFLLIDKYTCWLDMPPYTLAKFGHMLKEDLEGTFLDGEFEVQMKNNKVVKYVFWIFDLLFFKWKDMRQLSFRERFEAAQSAVESIVPYFGNAKIKVYYTEGNFYQKMRQAASEYKKLVEKDKDSVDGIIIQPSGLYFNDSTYKWKPKDQLTIDFRFWQTSKEDAKDDVFPEITEDNYYRSYFLTVKGDKEGDKDSIVFRPYNDKGFNGTITFSEKENYAKWMDIVVECKWDYDKNNFIPVRIRDDRRHPNSYGTALGVWKDILNPIALSTITGEDLVIMRKYHNQVKGAMLSRYLKPGDVIIDIGSGRLGDGEKWTKLGLERVFAVEPNEENIKIFNERLTSLQLKYGDEVPSITLLDFGAENTGKIVDALKGEQINAIVSFFSLTYFSETSEKYKKLMDTINLIPKGGFFIGAVMDGEAVIDLLEKQKKRLSATEDQIREAIINKEREIKALKSRTEDAEEGTFGIKKQLRKLGEDLAELNEDLENVTHPSYYPKGDDEPVEYKNSAFSIEQITEIDRDVHIGTEILISINDPTSMVKNQQEWLFFFKKFRKDMERKGFELIRSEFLDGKDASFLSKEAYTFSALNRSFCFFRSPKFTSHITLPEEGDIEHLQENDYDDELVLYGVPSSSSGKVTSSFVNAILQCIDEKYRELDVDKKIEYSMNLRKRIAKKLTIEEFEEIHGGEYAKRMEYYQVEKKGMKQGQQAKQAAFVNFKLKLVDPQFNVADTSLLEILSKYYDISIYILNVNNQGVSPYFYTSNKIYCDKVLDHDIAIILGRNEEFYAIGRQESDGIQYTFQNDDRVILALRKEVCGEYSSKERKENKLSKPLIVEDVIFKPSYAKMTKDITGYKSNNVEENVRKFHNKLKGKEDWHTIKEKSSGRYDPILQFLPESKKLSYLDIGCGDSKDSKEISELIGAKQTYFADVKKQSISFGKFVLITENIPLKLTDDSIDVITMLHSAHHAKDLQFRLLDLYRILKPGGILFIKDHNVETEDDAYAVNFEHFIYSVGEGKLEPEDSENFFSIEPIYHYSAEQLKEFLNELDMEEVYFKQGKKITNVYYAIFKKM